jgi:hypothetical protein
MHIAPPPKPCRPLSSTLATHEIRKYQKATGLLILKTSFQHLVEGIAEEHKVCIHCHTWLTYLTWSASSRTCVSSPQLSWCFKRPRKVCAFFNLCNSMHWTTLTVFGFCVRGDSVHGPARTLRHHVCAAYMILRAYINISFQSSQGHGVGVSCLRCMFLNATRTC